MVNSGVVYAVAVKYSGVMSRETQRFWGELEVCNERDGERLKEEFPHKEYNLFN
jgi:hypothetical protein